MERTKRIGFALGTALLGLAGAAAAGGPESVCPALVGTEVPDVTVRDAEAAPVKLRPLAGRAPTVLIFYRGGW